MPEAYLCDAIRTPIGRYRGALAPVRADDLGAIPIKALAERNPPDRLDSGRRFNLWLRQPSRRNRHVARMTALLAGLPEAVPGTTVNRLCGSGMDAVGMAARAIKAGDADLMVAGGVEMNWCRSTCRGVKPSRW